MAPITAVMDVGRLQVEVFDYVTDPTRFVEWQHGVVAGHMEGDGPYGRRHPVPHHAPYRVCRTGGHLGDHTHPAATDVGYSRHRRAHPGDRARHRRPPR